MKRSTVKSICYLTCTILAFLIFYPAQVHSQLIKFGFSGEVSSVFDPLNITNGSIKLGDAVSGVTTFSNEPTFVDTSQPNTSNYVYLFDPLFRPLGTLLRAGSAKLNGVSPFPFLNISITNDDPVNGDIFVMFQPAQYPDSFLPLDDPSLINTPPSYPNIGFILSDPTGTALSSTDLPLTAPDLSAFNVRTGFIQVLNADTGDLLAEVDFNLNNLQTVPEPESSCWIVSLFSTVIFVHQMRRRRV